MLLICFLSVGVPVAVADDEAKTQWQQVKQLIASGSYREALSALEHLETVAPDNPFLSAYRSLCEERLRAEEQWVHVTPAQLAAVQEALERESAAQRRSQAQMEAIERQIHREQAMWDGQLRVLRQQSLAEQKVQERAKRLEVKRRRDEATRRRQLAKQPSAPAVTPRSSAPAVSQPIVPSAPEATKPSEPTSIIVAPPSTVHRPPSTEPTAEPTPSPGTIELESVQVEVAKPLPSRPAGAVQIFADQMNMMRERNLANARGHVRILFEGGGLTCDRMAFFTDTKDVYAEGNVRIQQGNEVYRADLAHYNMNTHKGRFLQGHAAQPPLYSGGQVSEHLAEGVTRVIPGYVTTCSHDPPHFRFQGRSATVFSDESLVHGRHVTLFVEEFPLIYLPWLSVADRQSPFFFIPGKKKPWEQFALMGYRYEWPADHQGALRWDWRRAFGWGFGLDHRFETPPDKLGKGLIKLYYNDKRNMRNPEGAEIPKGALHKRYRVLVRHQWEPLPDTSVVTDYQRFGDEEFRREFLFREEYLEDKISDAMVSSVTGTEGYSLGLSMTKRVNRFNDVDEALPQVTLDLRPQRIGESNLFSETKFDVANLNKKRARSDNDTDVNRVDWFEQLSYALNWFRPVEVTPKVGVRQTYYSKDIQSGDTDRPQGNRHLLSGQFSMGADASLKLFRIFPVVSNVAGLNLNLLRHVVTPTLAYTYIHQPTAPSSLFTFPMSEGTSNQLTFGLENKLQTKRPEGKDGKLKSVDLARWTLSIPYTFRGNGNKRGGLLGDWSFDVELTPWPWLRIESDWAYPSHFVKGSRDNRITAWNLDVAMVGGRKQPQDQPGGDRNTQPQAADQAAYDVLTHPSRTFEPGPRGALVDLLLPQGQWYLGLGHRYSHNDKTEEVLQFDWRLSQKWEIGTFHRFALKEVSGNAKRLDTVREYQYILRRDLHDWIGEVVYRVDREFGEELFLTLTLKAYPELPFEFGESYHQPKSGSQSSRF
ncbi:MAG: LPS assembly protein LptD [Candidatus Omnitrophica bacterium]|nr:LPS assembly protein LptD [Candidatus Omnitrophota bacterium]